MTPTRTICAEVDAHAELHTRIAAALEQVGPDGLHPLARNVDAMVGHPQAAAYGARSAAMGDRRGSGHAGPHGANPGLLDDGWRSAIADPTGEAAIRGDRAAHDRREFVRRERTIGRLLEDQLAFVVRYGVPTGPSAADRAALERSNVVAEPGCEHCATIEQAKGVPFFSPIRGEVTITNAAGDMATSRVLRLCQDCRAFFAGDGRHDGHGTLPPSWWLENRRDGKRNRWSVA